MNENVSALEQAVADIIVTATETVGEAKDFVLAELPDVVQQLLLWKAVYNFMWFVTWIALSWACYHMYRRMDAWVKEDVQLTSDQKARLEELRSIGYSKRSWSEDKEFSKLTESRSDENNGAQYLCLIPIPFMLAGALSQCMDWLQILIAHKVYLIEYSSRLIGG